MNELNEKNVTQPADKLAKLSLWLNLGLLLGPIAGIVSCTAAVICGFSARNKGNNETRTIVGIGIGFLGILICLIWLIGMNMYLVENTHP